MGFYSKHIFPRLMDWGLGSRIVARERRAALDPARGNVLEIGFGTGLNLPHYPPAVTKLTVIDPNPMLPDRVARRISEAKMPVEQLKLDASGRLPFEDASFDSVVSTFTLCSIDDLAAAMREIRRVLRPEGLFLFLEHGRSDDPRVAKRQDFLNPLQKIVGCGCNMNRAIGDLIRQGGFRIVKLDRYVMPDTPRLLGELYRGIAHPD
ncbi:MAG TPA: class I SAM-dependent methyltransferase [Blastocatellia bacterium]|nr:class I SAM-dependent methyltransferase [Blastocatellia bacterium]